MVMKKNILAKNLRQSIVKSLGRYIAIIAIIALGAAIFVGLRTTKTDMIATAQQYIDEQNMFDLHLLSTFGWNKEDVEKVREIEGIEDAEGGISMDAIMTVENGEEAVYKLHSIPATVNKIRLQGGRMPEAPNECLADGSLTGDEILGTTFTVSERNEDQLLDSLQSRTFTVVGYVSTPLYMDLSRGNTNLGNGTVASYLYLPEESFDLDYYTDIYVTIPGDHEIYSEEYNEALDQMAEYIEPLLKPIAMERYTTFLADAEKSYQEGVEEYQDGLAKYEDGKRQSERELMAAEQQLTDAEAALARGQEQLADGQKQLEAGEAQLNSSRWELQNAQNQLEEKKRETEKMLADSEQKLLQETSVAVPQIVELEKQIIPLNEQIAQLDADILNLQTQISPAESKIEFLRSSIAAADASISVLQASIEDAKNSGLVSDEVITGMETALAGLIEERNQQQAQLDDLLGTVDSQNVQLAELQEKRQELDAKREELRTQKAPLVEKQTQLLADLAKVEFGKIEAKRQFEEAARQIEDGFAQLENGTYTLEANRKKLEEAKLQLDEGTAELSKGWEEYRKGKETAQKELSDAEVSLCEGASQLRQTREMLDSIKEPDVFVLDRNTNSGYLSVDNNSDIVAGISKVFPAFFLLVAALVCITTMTRMVEEERTQIGILKALGYSNSAIIGKYLVYAGSAAVLGCGLGVMAGSVVFPTILWQAYSIILNITPRLTLVFDWPLCIVVVAAYTAVTSLVTWYSCRRELTEVPAELIRPRPPTSGKKIFLEYLPFWNKISFLNKVMLRNVFRYRQRLLMMLVGIGGCTALLLTGFGIKDSIMDIVDIQFDEVTLYDLSVRFADHVDEDEQQKFRDEISRYVDQIGFYHQSSVDIDFEDQTKSITMIAGDSDLANFINFHSGDRKLPLPETNEALISIGTAEEMGIRVGDVVSVRNLDMQTMDLEIVGIYDNHVYNNIVVNPQTIRDNWQMEPEIQMACLTVTDAQDAHYASTRVSNFDGVINVLVSQDMADQVNSMLEALILVVITVVVCAGMLAVTVLYNLTNINITERIREIATIKVLGFNAAETAAYVFKENLLLTAMGTCVGLLGGKALLAFVMSQIKVDMVWFEARALPLTYVWSVLLTLLSAFVVDFVLYFKLDKINMAEALKSVE